MNWFAYSFVEKNFARKYICLWFAVMLGIG